MIRVLLADDHTIVREGVRLCLEAMGDIEVVAEAEDGQLAVQLANQLRPDVAVVDLTMPRLNGVEAIRGAFIQAHDVGNPAAPGSAWCLAYIKCNMLTPHENIGIVKGGMGAITQAMAAAARSYGATLKTGMAVAQILIERHPDRRIVYIEQTGHGKGDAAVRGPASALLLVLVRRLPLDDAPVQIIGDRAVLERWLAATPF